MRASRSCCRFVGCTSMMRISRSTTSQSCSIGLRSGDCGGHLSKVNSLSCSRNQSEMIWALWHGALSCWKYIRRWVHCSHKGMDMVSNNTSCAFRDAILYTLVVTSGYLSHCCLSIISNHSAHSPLTSDTNKAFSSTQLPLTALPTNLAYHHYNTTSEWRR